MDHGEDKLLLFSYFKRPPHVHPPPRLKVHSALYTDGYQFMAFAGFRCSSGPWNRQHIRENHVYHEAQLHQASLSVAVHQVSLLPLFEHVPSPPILKLTLVQLD